MRQDNTGPTVSTLDESTVTSVDSVPRADAGTCNYT
jgi:hypothetical protein